MANLYSCPQLWIPIRAAAASAAEMTSCLVYGETFAILEENEDWFLIKMNFDEYIGWVSKASVLPLKPVSTNLSTSIVKNYQTPSGFASLPFTPGSEVLQTENIEIFSKFNWKGDLFALSEEFLGVPYLWGGRTMWGIDCSGLVQMACKMLGISIPRDAKDQALQGIAMSFEDIKRNDLAFFQNAQGKITHVGICDGNGKIIHASGNVHIDNLDKIGIYNLQRREYSHYLSSIKRIIFE